MNQRELIAKNLSKEIYKEISTIKRTENNKEVIRHYISNMVNALDFEVCDAKREKESKEGKKMENPKRFMKEFMREYLSRGFIIETKKGYNMIKLDKDKNKFIIIEYFTELIDAKKYLNSLICSIRNK